MLELLLTALTDEATDAAAELWFDARTYTPFEARFLADSGRRLETTFHRRFLPQLGATRATETVIIDGLNPQAVTFVRLTDFAARDNAGDVVPVRPRAAFPGGLMPMPTRLRCVAHAALLAAVLATATGAGADELDALSLESAPQAEASLAVRPLRLFVEGALGHANRRYGLDDETLTRAPIDFSWAPRLGEQWRAPCCRAGSTTSTPPSPAGPTR